MQNKSYTFLKWSIIIALAILATYSAIDYFKGAKTSTIPSSAKKERWEAMEKEVHSWGDALGMGIDPQIKKTVIVLNLLGFKTTQSCEGHIDRALPYPWVRITTETPEIEKLIKERNDLWAIAHKKETEIAKKHPGLSLGEALRKEPTPELDEIYKKYHRLNADVEKALKARIKPLQTLLKEFYTQRRADPEVMLTINANILDLFELSSPDGIWQITRSDQEKLKKLQAYQGEMNAFADFLSNYYFNKP